MCKQWNFISQVGNTRWYLWLVISLLPSNLKWTVVVIVFLNVKLSIYVGHMAGFLSIIGIVLEILKTWVFISYVVCFKCFTFSSEVLFTGFFQFFLRLYQESSFLKKKNVLFFIKEKPCAVDRIIRESGAVQSRPRLRNGTRLQQSPPPLPAQLTTLFYGDHLHVFLNSLNT